MEVTEKEAVQRAGLGTNAPPGEAPWKALGRDSPAGKALYKLYGNDIGGKKAGQDFHSQNKLRHEAKLSSGWMPSQPKESPPPVMERPQINYPRFGREKQIKVAPPPYIPHRKQGAEIQAEMAVERERMQAVRPVARGPLLDDKEKERLAQLMQFRGKLPEVCAEEEAASAVRRAKRSEGKSELQELQELFEGVMQEIEERKDWLRAMEANKALGREEQHQVNNEIKHRVKDLERLDFLINQHQGQARPGLGR